MNLCPGPWDLSRYNFTSLPCTIVTPTVVVQCVAPVGVGARHSVRVVVDGVSSDPLPNATLSYAPPVVSLLTVAGARSLEDNATVGTAGGSLVLLTGLNFGPASGLLPVPLGMVTYTPVELLLVGGIEVC